MSVDHPTDSASPRNTWRVYFFQAGDPPLIKIGITNRNIAGKLKLAQTYCPYRLTCIGFIDVGDDVRAEGRLHKQFEHLRTIGEWFRAEKELTDFIYRNASRHRNTDEGAKRLRDSEIRKGRDQLVVDLRRQGRSAADIGVILNLHRIYVHQILRRMGWNEAKAE